MRRNVRVLYVPYYRITTTFMRESNMLNQPIDKAIRESVLTLILNVDEHLPKPDGYGISFDLQVLLERFIKIQLQLRGLIPFTTS